MTLTGGAPIWSPQLKGSFSAWGSSIASATIAGGLLLAAACALAVLHPTGPLGRLGQRAVHEGNQEWLLGRSPPECPFCVICAISGKRCSVSLNRSAVTSASLGKNTALKSRPVLAYGARRHSLFGHLTCRHSPSLAFFPHLTATHREQRLVLPFTGLALASHPFYPKVWPQTQNDPMITLWTTEAEFG